MSRTEQYKTVMQFTGNFVQMSRMARFKRASSVTFSTLHCMAAALFSWHEHSGGAVVQVAQQSLYILSIMLPIAINCTFIDFLSVSIDTVSFYAIVSIINILSYSLHLLLFL